MSDKRPLSLNCIGCLLTGSFRSGRPTRLLPLAACLALSFALRSSAHAQGQSPFPRAPAPPPAGQSVTGSFDDQRDTDPVETARRVKILNEMRQKAIVSDANKLLKLAAEIDTEIQKADSASPTADQLRKLAAIEKLAHGIKERMSTPIVATPVYEPPRMPTVR